MNKINSVKAVKTLIYICLVIGIFLIVFRDFIFYPEKYQKALQFPTKKLDRSIPIYIEADLGGMKVKIPDNQGYASFINYNGQANDWDTNGSKVKYEKTHIRGFGFNILYPNLTGAYESDKNFYDYLKRDGQPNHDGSFFISGIVTSGENYHLKDGEYFRNLYENISEGGKNHFGDKYKKNKENRYDLEVYELYEVDKNNISLRDKPLANDYFFHKNSIGKIDVYGRCPSHPKLRMNCSLTFTLLPKSKTIIELNFNHKNMENWKSIMHDVSSFYLNFEVK